MENKSKAETFIGFAIRARKHKIGLNAVATLKKANLIIVCHTASENTVNDARKLKNKFHCKMLITVNKTLGELTHRENAKVMAIADYALAKAIIDNSEKDFIARD